MLKKTWCGHWILESFFLCRQQKAYWGEQVLGFLSLTTFLSDPSARLCPFPNCRFPRAFVIGLSSSSVSSPTKYGTRFEKSGGHCTGLRDLHRKWTQPRQDVGQQSYTVSKGNLSLCCLRLITGWGRKPDDFIVEHRLQGHETSPVWTQLWQGVVDWSEPTPQSFQKWSRKSRNMPLSMWCGGWRELDAVMY